MSRLGVLGLFAHRRDRLEPDQDQNRDAGLDEHEAEPVRRDDRTGGGVEVKRLRVLGIARLARDGLLGLVAEGERLGNGMAVLIQLELAGVVLLPRRIRVAFRQAHRRQGPQHSHVCVLRLVQVILGDLAILLLKDRLALVVGLGRVVGPGVLDGLALVVRDIDLVHVVIDWRAVGQVDRRAPCGWLAR